MKYTNIKRILKTQIDKGVPGLWTWDKKAQEFNHIYKVYDDQLKIYTNIQLLEEINEEERRQKENS